MHFSQGKIRQFVQNGQDRERVKHHIVLIAAIFSLVWRLFKILTFKILSVQDFDYSSICNSTF
jgi:hypothetical protein